MPRMTQRLFILAVILLAARFSAQADAGDLVKSSILENSVAYLRVGEVGTNLPEEIQSAQSALSATNKIAGTVLDLRFADGDDLDSEKAAENLFASNKSPLAIIVNAETRGAAIELAKDLRAARAGLIFGGSTEVEPDIPVSVSAADEKEFMENPFGTISTNENDSDLAATNDFLPFVDHTSEADLVREKIKDNQQPESTPPTPPTGPQKPFIRDPVLARGVDFIKGLAALHLQSKS